MTTLVATRPACSKCNERPRAGLKSQWCTECRREANRTYWRSLSPEQRRVYDQRKRTKPAARWRNSRKASHLMSEEEYQLVYAKQGGRCALCGGQQDVLVIDHCHARDVARELLCSPCNVALGMFKDDPALLRRAADYLEKYR